MPLPKGWSLAEKSTPVAQPTGLPSGWSLAETGSDVGGPKDFNVNVSHQENLPQYSFSQDIKNAYKAARELEMKQGLSESGREFDPSGQVDAFASKFASSKVGEKLVDPILGVEIVKTGDDSFTHTPKKATAIGAFSRAFAAGTPEAMGSAYGVGVAQPLSSALLQSPNLAMKGLGLGTAIIGGITGALGVGAVKNELLPEEIKAQLARDRDEQKIAAISGNLVSQAPFFGVGGASAAQRAIMGGVGAGVPVAIAGGQKVLTGQELPPDLLEQAIEGAAGGAVFANPTKQGAKLIKLGESLPGAQAASKLAPKPKIKLEIPEPATDITDNLGNAKAGQPLSKTQQDANTMALGKEDLTVLEPAGPLDFGPMPNERGALANEIAANPQAAIDARMVRNAPSAESTVLADLEVRAAAAEKAKQIADANQIAINDARGVRQPEPQNAERSVLVERAAEGVDQIAIPEVQVARQKEFNDRVVRVTENLKAEGVELDRQTAAKLALIKDPQEFNAARQQLIDSVKPPTHEIPKAGPVKSLSDLPEIAGPRDLVGPRVPDVLTPSRKKQVAAMPEVAKPVESKGIAIPEAPVKPTPTPEPVVEKPALDAKEAIIQDPNLDADTKIEILQKMATAKPKRDKQTLAQKLLARKKEVEATKAKPVEPVAEPTPEPIKEAPVVEESAPTDPLGDKLAYLDEQLAGGYITKDEHTQFVKEANDAFSRKKESDAAMSEAKKQVSDFDKQQADAYEKAKASPMFEEVMAAQVEFEKANSLAKSLAEYPRDYSPAQRAQATRKANKAAGVVDDLRRKAGVDAYASFELAREAKRRLKNNQAGFSSGAVMANMAAPAVGAAIGSNIGDTPEERVRNAMIGAGIASGSTASLTALASMIKKNPNILKEFKDGFSSAKEANAKQPSLTEQVNAHEPATPSTPDGIGADTALGNMGKSPVWDGGMLKAFPALADTVEKITVHTDSLYEVSPKLAGALRNWMYESSKLLSEATTRSVSPLTRLRKLVGKEDFEGRIWGLLREGREADVLASLDKAGPEGKSIADGLREGWIKDRPEMLEMLRQANPGKVVYVDGQPTYPNQNIGELDNYWPSFVEDLDGLRKAMGTKYKSDIDVAIAKRQESKREEYLKEAAARGEDTSKIGMPSLSDTEIGDIITGVLTKPSTQGNTPGMGNTKKRTIKEIPAELRKFYAPPDLALAKYYQRAFDSALSKKYTGKANPDGTLEFYGKENSGIFGDILIDGMNDKSIDPKGAQRAVENINSFGKNPDSWKISRVLAPKIAYLQVAGNLAQASSAITQLADVIQTIANTSAKDTFGGFFIDPIVKGKRFKRLKDIGVQEGITEFYEHSKTSGTASWVMDNVFLPLFKPTDKFMKQGIANSNLRFLESGLKAQESGKPTGYRFDIASDRYKSMQGIEEWNKLADAVKRGEWDSDVVNKFAFNRLSDVQPITKAEQAIGKSQLGAGGKIAFGLTGFMLRQMNTLRSNAVGAWRRGNKWDAAKYVAGFLTAQAVAGYTIGTIKGWINGDDDAGVNNIGNVILATFGLNRFMFNQAYDKDFSSIVGERILPGVFSPAKDIISDIGLARDMVTGEKSGSFLEQSEFAKRTPLVGDIYYKNAGAGKEKREKRERSGAESPNDLEKLYDLIEGVDNRKRGSR